MMTAIKRSLFAGLLLAGLASPSWAAQTLFGQKSVFCYLQYSATTPAATGSYFLGLTQGAAPWTVTETVGQSVLGSNGNVEFSHFTEVIPTAPGGTASWTFTLRKNGADTALTCAISGATTTCTDSTHYVVMSPGDVFDLKVVGATTPTTWANPSTCTFQVQTDSARESVFFNASGNGQTLAAATTNYQEPDMGGMVAGERNESGPAPSGRTLAYLYAHTDVDPGSTKTLVCTLRVNEADTAITCTITGNGTNSQSCNDTTHSVTINAGDRVDYKWVNGAGAATCRPSAGLQYLPAFDGRSVMQQGVQQAINTNTFTWNGAAANATVGLRQVVTQAGTVRNLVMNATDASFVALTNASETVSITLSKNSVDTAETCTITPNSSVIVCQDTTHSVTVVQGDLLSLHIVIANAGVTAWVAWGLEFDTGLTTNPPQLLTTGAG